MKKILLSVMALAIGLTASAQLLVKNDAGLIVSKTQAELNGNEFDQNAADNEPGAELGSWFYMPAGTVFYEDADIKISAAVQSSILPKSWCGCAAELEPYSDAYVNLGCGGYFKSGESTMTEDNAKSDIWDPAVLVKGNQSTLLIEAKKSGKYTAMVHHSKGNRLIGMYQIYTDAEVEATEKPGKFIATADNISMGADGATAGAPVEWSCDLEAGRKYYLIAGDNNIACLYQKYEATGGEVIEGEKVMLFYPDGAEAANEITFPGDYKIAITGNTSKTISGGNNITIDGTQYKSMKVSNGAQNTLTLPSGLYATKLTFFSYVNKDAQTDRPAFWKEVGGVDYDITTSGGELMSFKDGENPDVRTYTLEKPMNVVTFTNSGEQLCYVLVVNVIDEAAGIEGVEVVTPAKNVIYNLSGQKVDASYKGVVIMNGKKYVVK